MLFTYKSKHVCLCHAPFADRERERESVCVLVAQSCPTLCSPMDCSPPGPSIPGVLQARVLDWVAISFSKRNYRKKVKSLSHV